MDAIALINIAAIIIGPIAAVVVTRIMDSRREMQTRRFHVFRDLLRTRSAKLSPAHVDALNLVEIEFHSDREVKEAWQHYMENLRETFPEDRNSQDNLILRREQLFIKLIQEVSRTIGMRKIDITDVMINNYYPNGWNTEQAEQQQIRQLLISVFSGAKPLVVRQQNPSEWNGPYPPIVPNQKQIDRPTR